MHSLKHSSLQRHPGPANRSHSYVQVAALFKKKTTSRVAAAAEGTYWCQVTESITFPPDFRKLQPQRVWGRKEGYSWHWWLAITACQPAQPQRLRCPSLEDISAALTVTSGWALTLPPALLRVVSGCPLPPEQVLGVLARLPHVRAVELGMPVQGVLAQQPAQVDEIPAQLEAVDVDAGLLLEAVGLW